MLSQLLQLLERHWKTTAESSPSETRWLPEWEVSCSQPSPERDERHHVHHMDIRLRKSEALVYKITDLRKGNPLENISPTVQQPSHPVFVLPNPFRLITVDISVYLLDLFLPCTLINRATARYKHFIRKRPNFRNQFLENMHKRHSATSSLQHQSQ